MPCKLTLEKQKFILKQYWKTGNAQNVIRQLHHCLNTELQHIWLFINFETNLMKLAQLPILRVLDGRVCALMKI